MSKFGGKIPIKDLESTTIVRDKENGFLWL